MFKNAYHGGPAVEVFQPSGKNPFEKWKVTGTVHKNFDKELKSTIYSLDGQTKI